MKNRKNNFLQGSFTVEAAMITGVIMMAILSVLTGARIVYNRAIMTAGAYENAVTGREHKPAGLWGQSEIVEVDLESLKPAIFIRKAQTVKEMR